MPPTNKINEMIFRFNSQYFYSERVNTYLINLKDKVLLFDLPTYSKEIENYLSNLNKPIFCVLSHGPCGIADGRIWQRKLGIKIYLQEKDKNDQWLKIKPDVFFTKPPNFDHQIQIIHIPGHTPGSICLYENQSKSLFTGDTFQGTKSGEVRDFMKYEWSDYERDLRLENCKTLLKYDFKNALPFHYEMIIGNAKNLLEQFVKRYKN